MQLILELLKKIFVALQGVYTKAETDAALATKADATALTAETQAREQADAKHDAEIDWLKTAVDGDWKTYMLARAKITGSQKNIDTVNRAIKEYGEDSTAALPNRMIEDWKNLYVDYEAWILSLGKKSPLKSDFWAEYFVALELWEADPTDTTWTATTNPYASQPRTSPIVDLKVKTISQSGNTTTFNRNTNAIVYFPNLTSFSCGMSTTEQNSPIIVPNVTNNVRVLFWGGQMSKCRLSDVDFRFGSATTMQLAFSNQTIFTGKIFAPNAGLWSYAFSSCRIYDNAVDMRSAHSAENAFANTAMSPENIAKTLDSLPNNPMGLSGSATGVITFSRYDGTLLAPLMAESPYKESVDAAVARGWTVQFDQ